MQGNPIPRFNERQDKRSQRALLALLLHEFPAHLTRDDLWRRGIDYEPLERAISSLSVAGLLWEEGGIVLPTLPARHFDWLELP